MTNYLVVISRDLIVLLKEIYEWTQCLSYNVIMFFKLKLVHLR